MPHQIQEDVRGLFLFRDIAAATFENLMHASYDQSLPPHVTLAREGAPADFLHVLGLRHSMHHQSVPRHKCA